MAQRSQIPRRTPVVLCSILGILATTLAGAQAQGRSEVGVTLYRDLGFSGTSQSFSDDVPDLRSSYVGNDTVTSVRISPGCRARLHADADYRGTYLEIDRDVSDLRGSAVGNDSITSLQVRCEGRGWSNSSREGGWGGSSTHDAVTLYRDLGFSGTSQSFSDDVPNLRSSYVGNDTVTSVRIGPGCRARLYADADYRGTYLEIDRDLSDLRGSAVGNDSVTSLQVRCRGGGWSGGDPGSSNSRLLTLFEDIEFRGTAYSFDSDVGDLRSSFGANDAASSVRVPPGCTARLYQDPQFRGNYTETDRDISDLRGSEVGNDSVSSLQLRCR
jgi:hypothetical protein